MPAFPFVGAAYTARSKLFDAQRCVNLYPEVSESGPGPSKSVISLIGTPGLTRWATVGDTTVGPVRGMFRFSPTLAIVVAGAKVYAVTPDAVSTEIGSIDGGSDVVSISSNGADVAIATGAGLFFFNPITGTSSSAPYAPDRVGFIDGYFVFNEPGSGRFRITDLYSTTINPLDFANAEGSPDELISLIVDHREVWLFGSNTTEVWYNSGNADFPLERIQGAFMEQGCAAKNSVAKLDNSVFWLAADDRGQGTVQRATGYQPQRISTHALELAIASYSRIDDAIAFTYQQEGHNFYVLSFPSGDATWVYDASTGLWHERGFTDPFSGLLTRHIARCHMAFAGKNLVGSRFDAVLYAWDLDVYTDDGSPITRVRTCPHISSDLKLQYFTALQIDMETGVGLTTGQGSDPQAMLQWSDDGGVTWSNEVRASIGRVGERKARVRWRRLGRSRERVFRLTISDPIKVCIVGASLEAMVGSA